MSISVHDFAVGVTTIATIIYTAGTFMLWRETRRNAQFLYEQLLLLKKQQEKQELLNEVIISGAAYDAHREIWLSLITNSHLLDLLHKSAPAEKDVTTAEMLASILINQCARIHLNFQHGIFNEEDFVSYVKDAQYLFSFPLVKWRWTGLAKYHSNEFVEFVKAKHIVSP